MSKSFNKRMNGDGRGATIKVRRHSWRARHSDMMLAAHEYVSLSIYPTVFVKKYRDKARLLYKLARELRKDYENLGNSIENIGLYDDEADNRSMYLKVTEKLP